jgi:hypothetical protein
MSTYYEIYPGGLTADSLSEAKEKAADHAGETGEDTYINLVTSVSLFRCRKMGEHFSDTELEELPLP